MIYDIEAKSFQVIKAQDYLVWKANFQSTPKYIMGM